MEQLNNNSNINSNIAQANIQASVSLNDNQTSKKIIQKKKNFF